MFFRKIDFVSRMRIHVFMFIIFKDNRKWSVDITNLYIVHPHVHIKNEKFNRGEIEKYKKDAMKGC